MHANPGREERGTERTRAGHDVDRAARPGKSGDSRLKRQVVVWRGFSQSKEDVDAHTGRTLRERVQIHIFASLSDTADT